MTIYAVVNNQNACWPEHHRYQEVIQMVEDGKEGFDPNSHKYQERYTRMNAFLMAAYRGCGIELFKAMLKKVKEVNEETGGGVGRENYTALMWACRRPKQSSNIKYIKNALDMVEILLQHEDIIINHPDMDGNRAIMHTIMTFGSASRKKANDEILEQRNIGVEIMNAFFNHRDIYYGINKQKQDLLHIAALHGCEPKTFDTICTKFTSLPDKYGNTALMHLVTVKKTITVTDPWPNVEHMMKKLLTTIDPNRKNNQDKTALIIAVEQNNTKMVKLLLKYTTDIDPTIQYNDKTALQIAMSNEQDDIVKIIIDYQTKLACQCSDLQACAMPRIKF